MEHQLKHFDIDWYKPRLSYLFFIVIGAFSVLILRLFHLQIIEGHEYKRLSENNCIRLQTISASRGLIWDRNGRLWVDNRPSFNLNIVLKDARPVKETVRKLSLHAGIPEDEIWKKIEGHRRAPSYMPILLKEDINRDMLASIEVHKYDLPGVIVDFMPKRHHIYREGAHVIGYLGEITPEELKGGKYPDNRGGDVVGKYGVEKAAEEYLKGRSGGRQVEVDARGQVIRILKTVAAVPGDNVYLTIQYDLQNKAESLLDGKVGAVVAMDPQNGDILAMASSPTFDPNGFVDGMSHEEWNSLISNEFHPLENKAVQGEYPPASTYKIMTALAGLEEGVINESTRFYCPGYYQFGDRDFRCWKKTGHGSVNVVDALAVSCDVFFYQVGQRLGVDRLARYAKGSGLGAETGINLGNEGQGLIPTSEWKKQKTGIPWHKGETLSIAIGQGYNLVTPLQMAVLTSAVANGGTLYRPNILRKIESIKGGIVHETQPEIRGRLPVSPAHLRIIQKGLWEVVNGSEGTARLIRVEGIDISGKTGTAQVFSRKKNDDSRRTVADHLKSHAWFVAYAKSGDLQIALAVIVEHGEHGSSMAAPIARDLITAYFKADGPIIPITD
jgi:penicillin-binding protein 2